MAPVAAVSEATHDLMCHVSIRNLAGKNAIVYLLVKVNFKLGQAWVITVDMRH